MESIQEIVDEKQCYFIADIAANHDGDLSRAKDLIFLAKEAGAHVAKFQHFLPHKIVSAAGFENLGHIKTHQSSWKKSVYDVYDQYHTKREWDLELYQTCQEAGIEFMTTPYDKQAIDDLDCYLNGYKIGSGDITFKSLIERILSKKKNIILASGASHLSEVEQAMKFICSGADIKNIALLQCNTNYTGDLENFKYVNLNVLKLYRKLFPGVTLGLSDHTPGHATVLGAVALGAKVIEKHFTDDNRREGPDHKFAMNPISWREMVERTGELLLSLGDGNKIVEKNELESVIVQRRSVRAARDIPSGEILTYEDLESLRPCTPAGISPWNIEQLLNKQTKVDLKKGDEITFGDLIC